MSYITYIDKRGSESFAESRDIYQRSGSNMHFIGFLTFEENKSNQSLKTVNLTFVCIN
jgi:hypothetical protein